MKSSNRGEKQLRQRKRSALAGAVALVTTGALGIHSTANAQQIDAGNLLTLSKADLVFNLQRSVYSGKFTCGIFDQGKTFAQVNKGLGAGPPLDRDHSPVEFLPQKQGYYYDFQPGTYSTALNIFNPTLNTLSVEVKISTESVASPATVARLTIPSLNAVMVGCSDIEAVLPDDFKGELVEGFFHISRFSKDIQVQAVYTYTSIAAFQEFRGGFVDDFGVIPGDLIDVFPAGAGAGAGAGGLGLGASVDIETIEPIMVN